MLINLFKLTILSSRIWNQSLKPGLDCQVSIWEMQIWVKVWWGKRWSLGRHVPWWVWIYLESRRQYPLEQSNGRDTYPPLFCHILIPLDRGTLPLLPERWDVVPQLSSSSGNQRCDMERPHRAGGVQSESEEEESVWRKLRRLARIMFPSCVTRQMTVSLQWQVESPAPRCINFLKYNLRSGGLEQKLTLSQFWRLLLLLLLLLSRVSHVRLCVTP